MPLSDSKLRPCEGYSLVVDFHPNLTPGGCSYVLVAIIKKRLVLSASMHAIMQVLSLSLFETTPLHQLLGHIRETEPGGQPNE